MTKILQEIREISSTKIAEKQKKSESGYPDIIKKIKAAAENGKTECKFSEHEIDQYTKRLLEQDGFHIYATTELPKPDFLGYMPKQGNRSIWVVSW